MEQTWLKLHLIFSDSELMTLLSNRNDISANYCYVIKKNIRTWTHTLTGTFTFPDSVNQNRVPFPSLQSNLSVSPLSYINLSQWCPEADSFLRSVSDLDIFCSLTLYHSERSGVKHNAEARMIAPSVTPGAKAGWLTHTHMHKHAHTQDCCLYACMTCLYHYPNNGVCQLCNWVVPLVLCIPRTYIILRISAVVLQKSSQCFLWNERVTVGAMFAAAFPKVNFQGI